MGSKAMHICPQQQQPDDRKSTLLTPFRLSIWSITNHCHQNSSTSIGFGPPADCGCWLPPAAPAWFAVHCGGGGAAGCGGGGSGGFGTKAAAAAACTSAAFS